MADYTTNRSRETFRFVRVSWADFSATDRELGAYAQFTGGSVTYGAYSSIKASGVFSFAGDAPDPVDLLRVYYSFTDENGVRSEEHALGTFMLCWTTVNTTPGVRSGTATGYSVLKILQDRLCGLPLTLAAGTDPIAFAVTLIRSMGLRVNVQQDAPYSLLAPHTFEPDDTYLTVVNWCLSNCSTQYASADVDGYGVVQVQPYQEPTGRTPVWTFRDDERSIMQPEVSEENEWQTSANVVRLYHESDTESMWAAAANVSGSRSSLSNRGGRETTYYELIDEVGTLADLQALAVTRLKDRSSEIERVNITHAFVPITAGDAVRVEYEGRTWSGTVQNMTIELSPSAQCSTQLRRAVSAALTVSVDGGVLWTA